MIIDGDDETRDAISNGPCETGQALPRKRRKVRNSPPQSLQSQQRPTIGDIIERLAQEQQARERVNVEHESLNGENKVRLKLPKPNVPIKEEPLEPNEASDVQAKSGLDNYAEEDICPLCVRNIPLGDSGTSPIDWIKCDFCLRWFHEICVDFPPNFNWERDESGFKPSFILEVNEAKFFTVVPIQEINQSGQPWTRYHIEGDINAACGEILINLLCQNKTLN
uniref:Zinc finger PHD-type domain-containing protein n=1 Tax=Tetranychus urticae TaxID=32264 RepID=T1KKD2_TETUR